LGASNSDPEHAGLPHGPDDNGEKMIGRCVASTAKLSMIESTITTTFMNLIMRSRETLRRKDPLIGELLRRRSFIRLMTHWLDAVSMPDIENAFGLSRAPRRIVS
jgi:hypothetical protein